MNTQHNSLLIVDDNDLNCDLLARRLEREGYAVTCATQGSEALECMKLSHFDLVLLDFMMPGMDGYEVLNRMRQDPSLNTVPVMIVTAKNDHDNAMRCIEAGASDYILKPIDIVVLRNRIHLCLGAQERKPGAAPVEPMNATILVVDDQPLNRVLLVERATRLNHRAIEAETGPDALKLMQKQSVDVVLLDVHMPGMDGIAVLRQLKEDPALQNIPVIMISADDDHETITHCLNSGAADYICKPFNATELRMRLDSCLKYKRRRDAEKSTSRPHN